MALITESDYDCDLVVIYGTESCPSDVSATVYVAFSRLLTTAYR